MSPQHKKFEININDQGEDVKNYTITIDSGTTNTRIMLWNGERSLESECKLEVGARATAADGHNGRLKQSVRDGLQAVLQKAGLEFSQVQGVIASGMITSNLGLAEIDHVMAPAGVEELAKQARSVRLEDVCPLPVLFVPGLKNRDHLLNFENFEEMDMMRGEEVEAIALLESLPQNQEYLLALPGSHMKFVSVNCAGQMTGCLTTISGELLSAVTHNTILADTVGHEFVKPGNYDREMCLLGYRTARDTGLGRACFSARILNTFAEPDKQKLASYLLGAVLQGDIEAVKGSSVWQARPDQTVVISGKYPIRQALMDLFQEDGCFLDIREMPEPEQMPLSARGAFAVFDMWQLNQGN